MREIPYRYWFQFHLVRLKVLCCCLSNSIFITFQFHLVRLKVTNSIFQYLFSRISIPFSTIKSHCEIVRFFRRGISIPFSTIKSMLSAPIIKLVKIFQFHLVRLKAANNSNIAVPTLISIPFSTIKRDIPFPYLIRDKEISIPFSTIKSMKTKDVNNTPFIFQFHLVRLKACELSKYSARACISIPFSTIKRNQRTQK